MKEVKLTDEPMIGGCCVCSDERGWSENPLVYCDGPNCTVAVHQACYGIVSVPKGPWYCQKCESQERPTRLRCELCPNRDGALKKTDTASWVHVVCALYIPEVRFGNVTTMEPILLELVPQDRYSKVCYICQDNGKASKAHSGACMQCNKSGCKQSFHVTCAQAMGMLCEEAGNYLDNVKYCGYCKHHYSKLRKSNNVRTIPPFKPVEASGPPSSPEKECEKASSPNASSNIASTSSVDLKTSSQNGSKKKSTTSSNTSTSSISSSSSPSFSKQSSSRASSPTKISSGGGQALFNSSNSSSNLSSDMLNVSAHDKPNTNSNSKDNGSSSNKNSSKLSNKSGTSSSSSTKGSTKEPREPKHSKVRNHSKDSASSNEYDSSNVSASKDTGSGPVTSSAPIKETFNKKFTTSNFTESVVVASEPVFSNKSNSGLPIVKKRKLDKNESNKFSLSLGISDDVNREVIKDVSVTIVPLSDELKKQKGGDSDNKISHSSGGNISSNIIRQNEGAASSVSLVVSVPLSTTTLSGVNLASNTNTSSLSHQVSTIKSFASEVSPFTITNRSHNYPNIIIQQPADLQVKVKEKQQHHPFSGDQQGSSTGGAIVCNPSPSPTAISKISVCTNLGRPKTNSNQSACSSVFSDLTISKSVGPATIIPIDKNNTKISQMITDDVSLSRMSSTPDDGSFSDLKISYEAQSIPYESASITRTDIKNSPPSSPTHDMLGTHKRNHSSSNDASKDMKVFSAKDMQATHMLGNQLNPSSSVAQKMTDQLYMELEAHSVYTSSSMDSNTQLMGPVFPGRQLNNARNTAAAQPQGPSLASMLGGNGQPTAHGNTPQSLEQLLERQWEQGSQFLMEQAQHFDIASLLSCLHQLRSENIRLEEHVNNLVARRDHLLAVNARLAIPLNQVPQGPNQNSGTFNTLHLNGTTEPNSRSRSQHLK